MPESISEHPNPLAGIVLPEEIATIHCQDMTNGAHFLFMKNVSDRMKTETALLANPKIKKAADLLEAALKKEDECYAKSQKNLITDDIRKADEERGRYLNAMRRALKGFADHPEPDKARSAATLLKVMTAYRLDARMQLERETGAIISFVGDCEKTYLTDVQALGLKPYVDSLKSENVKIEKWLTEHSDSMPKSLGALRAARRDSDATYMWLVRVVNALAVTDDALDTAPFITHMNKVIRRNKTQVLGSKKKKDGEEPEKPKNPKLPKEPKPKKPGKDDGKPDVHLPEPEEPEKPGPKPPEGGGEKPKQPGSGDDGDPDIHLPEE